MLIDIFGEFLYISSFDEKDKNDYNDKFFDFYKNIDTKNIKTSSWGLCNAKSSYFSNNHHFIENYNPINFDGLFEKNIKYHFDKMLNMLKDNNTDKLDYVITEYWFNKYSFKCFQENHDHSGSDNNYSFVYILKTNENINIDSSRLYFSNPKYNLHNISNMTKITNKDNYHKHYKPKLQDGSIIIFPSYMEHAVSCHKIDDFDRFTIAGNIRIMF